MPTPKPFKLKKSSGNRYFCKAGNHLIGFIFINCPKNLDNTVVNVVDLPAIIVEKSARLVQIAFARFRWFFPVLDECS